ncbi:MAG: hypothetical protein PHX08_09960 [Lachnospiraceae bacterium]|nr:hypothetical protein [Lachnospiraceae bacterium]
MENAVYIIANSKYDIFDVVDFEDLYLLDESDIDNVDDKKWNVSR